ncbi:MAG: hypothetical protein ACAH17_00105 [Candidatus Paceibacterota bacterium]
MAVTLAQLKTRARERADQENSDFVSDEELTGYLNSSIAELHDLLVAAYGEDYFLEDPHAITTVSGTSDYALPDDFYKLKGVDVRINSGSWFSVRPFNFNERNRNEDVTWGLVGGPNIRYRIMGSKIKFSPAPTGAFGVQLWYVPVAPVLVDDADTFDDVNGYSEYIIVDAAIKMMAKEESDVSVLMAQKQALKRRFEEMALNRDAGQPESISDIYAENNEFWFWRS